jgi:hypothetical protein
VAAINSLGENEWPGRNSVKRRKRDRDFDRKVDEFLRQRDDAAAKLDIESCLIAPRAMLETIAAGEAKPSELLLKWQLECLDLVE